MQSPTARPLQNLGPFVLRHHPLDLQQQLVFRRAPDRSVREHHRDATRLQFLDEHHLVRVPPRQAVGSEHIQTIQRSRRRLITQALEGGSHQGGAADAVIDETQRCFQLATIRADLRAQQ
jgi:hypothetical protein